MAKYRVSGSITVIYDLYEEIEADSEIEAERKAIEISVVGGDYGYKIYDNQLSIEEIK